MPCFFFAVMVTNVFALQLSLFSLQEESDSGGGLSHGGHQRKITILLGKALCSHLIIKHAY